MNTKLWKYIIFVIIIFSLIFLLGMNQDKRVTIIKSDENAIGISIDNCRCYKHHVNCNYLVTRWISRYYINQIDPEAEMITDIFVVHEDDSKFDESYHYIYKYINHELYFSDISNIEYRKVLDSPIALFIYNQIVKSNEESLSM